MSSIKFAAKFLVCLVAVLGLVPCMTAQGPASTPDVLVFKNGDQLTGQLVSAAGGNVIFKSDLAGQVTVSLDKVRELRAGSKASEFALLKKGVVVTRNTPAPEGKVSISDANVSVAPAGSASSSVTVPVAEVDQLVSKAEFDKEIGGHSFFSGWNGAVTAGASLARATTSATSFTVGLNLVRAIPTVPWLRPRNRTILNVMENYGKNTSPGAIPQTNPPAQDIVTLSSIFHADAERDQYLSKRMYLLVDASFDHNYAQGLNLQQIYGAGAGVTAIKDAVQELDFKGAIHYEKQSFLSGSINNVPLVGKASQNLIGATLFEGYQRILPRKMMFTQSLNFLPAFNVANDYSANATAMLAIPVFKRLAASVSMTDNFLNDPAPGFKKNSYLFVTGVTYTLK
ncbi:MAG: DUF481 domain-containing protein [Bryocella sp.]